MKAMGIPGEDFLDGIGRGGQGTGGGSGANGLVEGRLEEVGFYFRQSIELFDDGVVIGNRAGEILLQKLGIGEFEVGSRLICGEWQALDRGLKSFLALGYLALQPQTPAQVQ